MKSSNVFKSIIVIILFATHVVAQTSIVAICDNSGSMMEHMYITKEDVGKAIFYIQNNNGGTLTILFTLENRVAPLRLRIPPAPSQSAGESALSKLTSKSKAEKSQQTFLKNQEEFMRKVDLYINNRYNSTPLNQAFKMASRLMKEPFAEKKVFVLSDGFDSFSANNCAPTKIIGADELVVIGWENDTCMPANETEVQYYFDLTTVFENLLGNIKND